ncbi:TonB-dependent receptor [Sphingosinicella sp.]|uniref:TonB-dependent receptor domain-containing protein n=1 Tax=Sphingosinicella sp. TaxID=1917971 RepID=UPI0017D9FEA8|nr:TonB-dependent receptor [Sphingosinicella sp.]MBA4760122.1 TonB-dependent receptor [Sphingosinicella sp.]
MTRISSITTLLLSSALISMPAVAQETQPQPQPQQDESIDISAPGVSASDEVIVVQGRYIPEPLRATPEVISVLSAAEIARTGEGDIAGALQRVTGLSLVGGRFVYVRGLGERYSLALLNGLPLPSPEPLRRVVPLDIFPTDVIASSVVQKSYSANYPGEFGGGVINLTTAAIPEESFLKVGGSISGDSETTFERGYTYYGSDTDWTGFDDGSRTTPANLKAAMNSGNLLVVGPNFSLDTMKGLTASLLNAPTTVVQRNDDIPLNGSLDFSGGLSFDIGSDRFGVIAAFGWDNSWETRGGLQQQTIGLSANSEGQDIIKPDSNFRFLSTENRIVVHGLLGFGYEFGEHKLRWTNLYIRDTSKEARVQDGVDEINVGSDRLNKSYTNWFERQLIDTQFVGEFKFKDVALDVRGTYANTQREAPYERAFSYRYDEEIGDFLNDLRTGGQSATISFSDLSEDVWAGSANVSWKLPTERDITLTAGYAYADTTRTSTRRDFAFLPEASLGLAVAQQRPDYLLSDYNIYTYDIVLTDRSGAAGVAKYDAGLEVHGGYVQAEIELMEFLNASIGVRYEDAKQFVNAIDLFGTGGGAGLSTRLANDYFLPAATITWNFAEDMQLRIAASKTIARPQFRELAPQQYFDTESDRTFIGNSYLTDSELLNFEARYEWYMGRNERVSLAGFYKKIDKPIEAIATQQGQTFFTTFANAPEAQLYGAELEVQKYFALSDWLPGKFFETRDLLIATNYTYTQSKIKVSAGDTTIPTDTAGVPIAASLVFNDGAKLTGQSDHIVNVQIGFEDSESLSQQTLMLTYASNRISNRFSYQGTPIDFIEEPGLRLDFVARQGFTVAGRELEVKFEARNLTGENYEEFQEFNGTRVDRNTYDIGRSFSLGLSAKF